MRIRIHAPLSHPEETEVLVQAGADTLYCGVLWPAWQRRFGPAQAPGAREQRTANLAGWGELEQVVRRAHRAGAEVSLTLNAFYSAAQTEALLAELPRALSCGVDGLIVAEPGLLAELRRRHPGLHLTLGTYAACFNREALAFYRDLGASRVVLPRHLSLAETCALARGPAGRALELEVFVLNMACKFIDGICAFQHGLNEAPGAGEAADRARLRTARVPRRLSAVKAVALNQPLSEGCYRPFAVTPRGGATAERAARVARFFARRDAVDACGCCFLPALAEAGVSHVKIVGRSNPLGRKLRDLRFVRRAVALLNEGDAESEQYAAKVRRAHAEVYGGPCAEVCYLR